VVAVPVKNNIDPRTRNLDLKFVADAITPRTRAIMHVYLAGFTLDMDELYALAKTHHLRVIEDAAQAFGSHWDGKRIGSIGDLVSFSFQANKNLTTVEGGCLVLNNSSETALAEKLRLQGLTRHGPDGMDVDVLGGKDNLTDINAVIGIHQLKNLPAFQARRVAIAKLYFELLKAGLKTEPLQDFALQLPPENFTDSNWHLFQVLLPLQQLQVERSQIMTALKALGIGTGVHYPIITNFSLYRKLGYLPETTPVAEVIGRSILTLPLFPAMSDADVKRVCSAFLLVLQQHRQASA